MVNFLYRSSPHHRRAVVTCSPNRADVFLCPSLTHGVSYYSTTPSFFLWLARRVLFIVRIFFLQPTLAAVCYPLPRTYTTRTSATMRNRLSLNRLRSKKQVDKTSKYEQDSLEYLSRITRHDSKKEKKTKLKYSFERNKVQMVRCY